MKQVKHTPDAYKMHGYLEQLGGIRHDRKTQTAYENFKRPAWYLNNGANNNKTIRRNERHK